MSQKPLKPEVDISSADSESTSTQNGGDTQGLNAKAPAFVPVSGDDRARERFNTGGQGGAGSLGIARSVPRQIVMGSWCLQPRGGTCSHGNPAGPNVDSAPRGGGGAQGGARASLVGRAYHSAGSGPTHGSGRGQDPERARRSKGRHGAQPQHSAQQLPASPPTSGLPHSRGSTQANHLLNFQSYNGVAERGPGSGRGRRPRHGPRAPPYDRNKFLAANFSFLVSDSASLEAATADADMPLEWEDVLQVNMQTSEAELTCPIALGPPVAPQITPCGHVFSFPAIVQHLVTHGGDNFARTAPCPLCFAQIAARELRLLSPRRVFPVKVGEKVDFALLRRPRGSIIPRPVHPAAPPSGAAAVREAASGGGGAERPWKPGRVELAPASTAETPPLDPSCPSGNLFAKFSVVADAAPLWRHAAEDLARFAAQVMAEGGPDAAVEAPFIWIAQDLLAARAATAAERRQRCRTGPAPPGTAPAVMSPKEAGARAARAVRQISAAATTSAVESATCEAEAAVMASAFPMLGNPVKAGSLHTAAAVSASSEDYSGALARDEATERVFSQRDSGVTASGVMTENAAAQHALVESDGAAGRGPAGDAAEPQGDDQFFWQAADGQAVFVDSLSARMLAAAGGGSVAGAAPRVEAAVLQLDRVTQTAATRRRYRMLAHVPLGGTLTMAELDLLGAVPREVQQAFGEEVAQRAGRRAARAKADAAAADREAARDRSALAATMGPSAAELQAMPRPGRERAEDGSSEDAALAAALAESAGLTGTGATGVPRDVDIPQSPEGVSFSSMARLGFAATGPALGSSPGGGARSPPSGGAWAAAATSGEAASRRVSRAGAPGSSPDDVALPAQWGAAIGSAAAAAAEGRGLPLPPRLQADGRRAKKGKPLLLFSSGQRQY